MSVIVETTIGDIVIDLFVAERPRASLNFLKLCKVKFYNYSLFHCVQSNFLAQSGDPTGSGQGGESIFRSLYGDQARYFEAETKPRLKHVKKGTVSMVNNGNDMHGSQFFVTLGENLDYLDGKHTVFGEVAEGFDILDKLNEAICDEKHRPYQDVRITHTVILDDPFDDPAGLKVPDRSPEPTKEQLDSGRIGADEEIDDTKGKTIGEINEMIEHREYKAGTQILEMVGDIPDADVRPPENVLFVCKLNPVTTDEDLEIIFSRFGSIKSCEIIKDSVSQESLQYAFIDYENVEDCERAYFKMDNVLIDDRRIHVDFSQSVAKVTYGKPGSKPVYKLIKDGDPNKSKLKIKDRSKDEKYDLVFQESDSDHGHTKDDTRKASKKKSKRRSHSSSDEDSSPRKRKSRYSPDQRRDKRQESGDECQKHGTSKDRYFDDKRHEPLRNPRDEKESTKSRDEQHQGYERDRKRFIRDDRDYKYSDAGNRDGRGFVRDERRHKTFGGDSRDIRGYGKGKMEYKTVERDNRGRDNKKYARDDRGYKRDDNSNRKRKEDPDDVVDKRDEKVRSRTHEKTRDRRGTGTPRNDDNSSDEESRKKRKKEKKKKKTKYNQDSDSSS